MLRRGRPTWPGAADIREWRDHAVVDPDRHNIGELEASYVDTSAGLPAFGTVRTGMPGPHRLEFVPVAEAIAGPGYLKVACDRTSEGLPSISTEGERPVTDEEAIFKHHSLPDQAGTSSERQLARC
jgi:hypothetical protein